MSKKSKKQTAPNIVHNLGEFLESRGFSVSDPHDWARCFYKYTECGPWAVFVLKGEAARDEKYSLIVARNSHGKLQAVPAAGAVFPPAEVLRNFGFEADGTVEREGMSKIMKSLASYTKALKEYQGKLDARDNESFEFWTGPKNPKPGEHKWVLIGYTRHIPATERELYYSDIRSDNPEKFPTNENCIGIKVGSIVEGSDVYSGPFAHYFPFDMAAFDRDVEFMEKETSFYWERDNSHWFHARKTEDASDQYSFHETWGDIRWDSDQPRQKKLREALEAYAQDNSHNDYDYHPLPNMPGWVIAEYLNDSTY